LNSIVLLFAGLLIIISYLRAKNINANLYISQSFLYNSITALAAGIYLLAVGMLAKAVHFIGGSHSLTLAALLLFLGLLALSVILLSGQLREQLKRFVIRNFKRPQYDYRKEWRTFTKRTASLMDTKHLSEAVANMVSETFGVPAVTIWVLDESQQHLELGGSTILSQGQAGHLKLVEKGTADLIRVMREEQAIIDLDRSETDWVEEFKEANQSYLREAWIRYCATLIAGQQMVGLLTLSEKLTKDPFSIEDFDLLKTISDQTAASLLNIKLSEGLQQARAMEAFQNLSAFFIHDLKNLASSLSLTARNFTTYYENPVFRDDALRTISQSVGKMNGMCASLSQLSKKAELDLTKADLNELVGITLSSLNGSLSAQLVQRQNHLPMLVMDPDQIQKVLVNLILNANEATGDKGEIEVKTEKRNGWAVLSVSDNGCGMSKDFIERSLFRPFQTTKKQGLGIGLYQINKIVAAHRGRIEVESEQSKGSTFRVMLPTGERE
jgi:putative PEP-CTERM system histidine kinase